MCIQMRLVPFFGFIGATSGVHTSVTHQGLGQRANSLAQHIAIVIPPALSLFLAAH